MKLSIITPYYNTYEYTRKLADSLEPQLTDEVEWLIIDDGCFDKRLDSIKAHVIHLEYNSGNASIPRNVGLSFAQGDYIAFIDSDDNVTEDYVETILNKTEEGFDYCYISWRSTDGKNIIIEKEPLEWNHSVWKCVYRRKKIDGILFDPKYNCGEDKKFNDQLPEGTKTTILKPIYIYTSDRGTSLTHRYASGEIKFINE